MRLCLLNSVHCKHVSDLEAFLLILPGIEVVVSRLKPVSIEQVRDAAYVGVWMFLPAMVTVWVDE